MRCNQRCGILSPLPLPVLTGRGLGWGAECRDSKLPLTPALSPLQEAGRGSTTASASRLCSNFTVTRSSRSSDLDGDHGLLVQHQAAEEISQHFQ
jgi:hypothetical protein